MGVSILIFVHLIKFQPFLMLPPGSGSLAFARLFSSILASFRKLPVRLGFDIPGLAWDLRGLARWDCELRSALRVHLAEQCSEPSSPSAPGAGPDGPPAVVRLFLSLWADYGKRRSDRTPYGAPWGSGEFRSLLLYF